MSQQPASGLRDDGWCFACGPHNPHGLHLSNFSFEGDQYVCHFTPQHHHQGWVGLVHGGIVAALLDEIMTRMLWEQGINAMTGELNVRYRQPAAIGQCLTVRGWVKRKRGKLIATEARMELADGSVVAEAQGKFVET